MAYETKDVSELERAKAWLDMAQAKWRLQTMQHRSRYDPKTGRYRQLPTRIRRFLNGTPVGMKTAVLALLKDAAPYRSPVFDCEIDGDLSYVPTNTFIRKDGIEHTTGGKDPTYTIIQDLLLDDGDRDAFAFGDESSCAQVGETEYRWDEPGVEDCPDGGQGVSYQVTDINRDRETDLFSYRIRKTQAITVHVAPHVTDCDNRKRVTTEIWDNVYGEPGAWRQDPVRGGSAPVVPPAPCGQDDGTAVKIDVYRNPDCTYRITAQTVEAKTDAGIGGAGAQYSTYRDRYKAADSFRILNAAVPLPRQGVEQSGGTTTRYTSERNEDGTWTNATETETEREVPRSTEETRVTPRGSRVSWTDTNARGPASGLPQGYGYGSWKSTKTPGGLYTNEYSAFARTRNARLGATCGDTAFVHTHETQESADSVPGGQTHVDAARDGIVRTRTYDTDADGFVTVRERVEREHTVENAVRRRTFGFLGTSSGFTHRSVDAGAANGLLGSQPRGTTVEARLTNGNMYDVDVQTFTRTAGVELGLDCSRTVFQHSHETAASAAAIGSEARAAGGGRTYRKSYSVDASTGAVTCREQVTEELAVPSSRKTVRVTARGTEVRSTSANAASVPADPDEPGRSLEWEMTPGGRYNVTEGLVEPRTGPLATECSDDMFVRADGTTRAEAEARAPSVDPTADMSGTYRTRRQQLGDDGLWTVSDGTTTEHAVQRQRVEERVTRLGLTRRTTDMQVASAGTPLSAVPGDVGKERTVEVTRGGRRNVTTVETVPLAGVTGESCGKTAFLHTHTATELEAELGLEHVDDAGGGTYTEESWTLTDAGTWERRSTEHEEVPQVLRTQQYEDAFGGRTVTEELAHGSEDGGQGGKAYAQGISIRSVESTMTNGKAYNVRTTEETPQEVDSGWLHVESKTDKGLATFHDFITFRNATIAQVQAWLDHVGKIGYKGFNGSFSVHPQANVSPNRFGLWDGTVGVTTNFTPKAWSAGGTHSDDNWEQPTTVKSVSFVPLSGSRLLRITTTETHRRGGGVGREKLAALVKGAVVKGSQFSYHPGGQAFSYDIITKVTSKGAVVAMPGANDTTIWDA